MGQSSGGNGRDYRESDIRVVFDRGPEWREWGDPIAWLRTFGPRDDAVRSADVRELLLRDFAKLQDDGVPFTNEPGRAYKLAHEHRPKGAGIERG